MTDVQNSSIPLHNSANSVQKSDTNIEPTNYANNSLAIEFGIFCIIITFSLYKTLTNLDKARILNKNGMKTTGIITHKRIATDGEIRNWNHLITVKFEDQYGIIFTKEIGCSQTFYDSIMVFPPLTFSKTEIRFNPENPEIFDLEENCTDWQQTATSYILLLLVLCVLLFGCIFRLVSELLV